MSDELRILLGVSGIIVAPIALFGACWVVTACREYNAMMVLIKGGWTVELEDGRWLRWIAPDGTVMVDLYKAKKRELTMRTHKELQIPERSLTYEAGSWR